MSPVTFKWHCTVWRWWRTLLSSP